MSFQDQLIKWYRKSKRDLPWRVRKGYPDPYHVLVSELMLQQTQVATVIPYFDRFIARFPTASDLACADGQEVLRLWQGLGYYSRARNLQRAAKDIVERYAGNVPATVDELLELPGIGRYTAGAIASLAYGKRVPILDGNVQRVLCRIDAIEESPAEPAIRAALWRRAEEILPETQVADFNSSLMELGATICTPKNPQCLLCPVREHCRAVQLGIQDRIPPAKKAIVRPVERRWVFCIEHEGHWLIEQRPTTGRWAGLWQFVTIMRAKGKPDVSALSQVRVSSIKQLGRVTHDLTHRRYELDAFACRAEERPATIGGRKWITLEQMREYPFPKPHLVIARLLGGNRRPEKGS